MEVYCSMKQSCSREGTLKRCLSKPWRHKSQGRQIPQGMTVVDLQRREFIGGLLDPPHPLLLPHPLQRSRGSHEVGKLHAEDSQTGRMNE